jgi:hypothetical protein
MTPEDLQVTYRILFSSGTGYSLLATLPTEALPIMSMPLAMCQA